MKELFTRQIEAAASTQHTQRHGTQDSGIEEISPPQYAAYRQEEEGRGVVVSVSIYISQQYQIPTWL